MKTIVFTFRSPLSALNIFVFLMKVRITIITTIYQRAVLQRIAAIPFAGKSDYL